MPCYDNRNEPEEVAASTRRECRHNSDVAELLCYVLTQLQSVQIANLCKRNTDLRSWWREHKARDEQIKEAADLEARERKASLELNKAIAPIRDQIRKKHGLV